MRNFGQILAVGAVLAVFAAGPAFAGSVYSWVTEEGTYAFTDDAKRIPAKYKAEAKRRNVGKLSGYEQLTRSEIDSDGAYGDRLGARLDGLRGQNQPAPMRGHVRQHRGGRDATYFGVRTGSRTALQFPVEGRMGGDQPIVVDKIRSKRAGGNTTRHLTVVKQGDRVISVVAPRRNDGDPVQAEDSDFY